MLDDGIIGRDREIARLETALEEAAAGRGGLFLLTGEPGIGKTRLAEDSERRARELGFRCAWGRCWESGGAPPFWPFTQVLRALRSAADEIPSSSSARLHAAFPDRGDVMASASDRFELFDAVGEWLASTARSTPLWIGLEDLHAADPASLVLLESLCTPLKAMRVMIVGTARDAAMAASPAHAVYLRVARQARTLALGRLAEDASRSILGGLRADDEEWLEAAVEATAGLPLFLVELKRLATTAGERLSPEELVSASIQTVLRYRADALSPAHRPVLIHAALSGMDVDRGLLEDLFGAAVVDGALGEAAALALVRPRPQGGLRLSHALLRDVLAAQLGPQRAEEAHALLATVLGDRGAAPEALAHHRYLAGPSHREAACEASLAAAESALARFAYEDALAQVTLIRERGGHELDVRLRARATVAEGLALIGLGRVAEGSQACRAAARQARTAGAGEIFAEAALACGSVYTFAHVDPRLIAMLEQALAMLPDGDSPLRAQLLARLAAARQPDPVPSRPIALARDAIAMAERIGDVPVLAAVLRAGCSTLVDLAHPRDRRPLDERHLEIALAEGLATDELVARRRLAFDCMELGDFDAANNHVDELLRLTEQDAHRRQRWRRHALIALRGLWRGELAGVGAAIEEARRLGRQAGDRNAEVVYLYQRARLMEITGDHDGLDELADALGVAFAGSSSGEQLSRASRARLLLVAGRTEAGVAAMDGSTARAVVEVGDRTMWLGVAMWAVASGDRALAERLADAIGGDGELFVDDGVSGMVWRAPVALVLSHVREALGDADAAWEQAAHAAQLAERAGGRTAAVEAHERAAMLASRLGREDDQGRHQRAAQRLRDAMDLPPASEVPAPISDRSPPRFERDGEVWCVRWRGRSVRVKATKGMAVLAYLVDRPGTLVHVIDLTHLGRSVPAVDRGDAGDTLDASARAAYRVRAEELREELAEAQANHDLGRAEAMREELEALAAELARGTALGGRGRRAPAAEERARQAIRKQIRTAIAHIAEGHADLGRYLDRAVQTGRLCQYDP